ncbi:thioredoxin-like domain protein [Burkholderia gladioli]|uniref:Thiol:disulfide interchange protein DsbG n=1 Tax=Burkholderia gladioli TaxID=28095 RepID=A0A095F329_BURGA|nr:thiol:disulfide interchange protein DsbG [Burkholderia gladioli]AJW99640.1 thioredoxin-like domain protein [Burkholderia gladioli]ASD80063.1 thiol:disulfide interchange protein DsbG [Burkholderia gladioli pv. gladioli]AWY54688.1 thiol:disulfide interchange protein DsbG [Burkholderia gladioli pv. gladioli]KGC11390.1 thioredoxin-like domain protein [Burkholderia gladioli]PEH37702.1 thiol:disulfide interchange protein DsbG [Burkholderia gladioli]
MNNLKIVRITAIDAFRRLLVVMLPVIFCAPSFGAQGLLPNPAPLQDHVDMASDEQQRTSLPLALQQAEKSGNKILKTFPAAGGFVGHVLQTAPRHYSIVYTLPGRDDLLVVGTLLSGKGENLSAKYISEYAPQTNYDEFSSRILATRSIASGASSSGAEIYVFMDPNCIFCHLLWKALLPYESAGLSVHWVPLGFLKKDSPGKAAALLDAANPARVLNTMETGFDERTESAAIDAESSIPKQTSDELSSNKKLFDAMGFVGTPAIVYRDASGHWQSLQGMPRLSALSAALSLPLLPQTDPELERFR